MGEPAVLRFTNLPSNVDWLDYQKLFSQFGTVIKLYIEPNNRFGSVLYENIVNAYIAQKELDGQPPFNLAISKPKVFDRHYSEPVNSPDKLHSDSQIMDYTRNSCDFDDIDVVVNNSTEYVDIFGRRLDTLEAEDGTIYLSAKELEKSGFQIFKAGTLPKPGSCPMFDRKLFDQYKTYLEIKSTKFIMMHNMSISPEKVNQVLQKLNTKCKPMVNENKLNKFNHQTNKSVEESSSAVSLRRPYLAEPHLENTKPANKIPTLRQPLSEEQNNTGVVKAKPVQRPQETAIQKISKMGHFEFTEKLSDSTFVAVVLPEELCEEIALLENIIEDCKGVPPFKPDIGEVVAVPKDEIYTRGIVLNNENDKYLCALIDYGVVHTVNDVYPLPHKYWNIPEFACVCKGSAKVIKELEENPDNNNYMNEKSSVLMVTTKSNVYEIECSRWDPLKNSPPVAKRLSLDVQKVYKHQSDQIKLQSNDIVRIVAEDNGHLLVRTKELVARLREINQEISIYHAEPLGKELEVNQLVLCPYQNMDLFRAKIKSKQGFNIFVQYLDYGNYDTVPQTELKTISEKLANIGNTLVKITLQGFVGTKFSKKAIEILSRSCSKKEKFTVLAGDGGTFDLLFADNSSLSQKLKELNGVKSVEPKVNKSPVQALPKKHSTQNSKPSTVTIRDIPKCRLSLGANEVFCLYDGDLVHGLVAFCLTGNDNVCDNYQEVAAKIDAYVKTDTTPYRPDFLEVCLANYEGGWYRAAYMTKIENGYGMFFIDYGNTHMVTSEQIRKMPKELAKYERVAVLCALQGVTNAKDSTVLEPLLSEIRSSIKENEAYTIQVISEKHDVYDITIPALYEDWRSKGLL